MGSTQFGGRQQSRPRSRRHCRNRGKGIARPEKPREPKQSCRVQTAHAWMWAIATARRVCWAAESEQAQSRVAWARAVPRDRCDLGHPVVAWRGGAVISSLPAHALLPIVLSGSDDSLRRASATPGRAAFAAGPPTPATLCRLLRCSRAAESVGSRSTQSGYRTTAVWSGDRAAPTSPLTGPGALPRRGSSDLGVPFVRRRRGSGPGGD